MRPPAASFNSGGIPDVVKHGEIGFRVLEGDVEALAHHLRLILEGPSVIYSHGRSGAGRCVCARFDLRRQTQRIEELTCTYLA